MKKAAMLLIAMAMAVAAWGQYESEKPLPMDSNIRYGKLPNGLTYYIWHNEKPEKKCEFKIAQKVGAILEEDHQNGLAHFLEHMCFNGTQHFPDKRIIEYFESIGVSFGGGINAYTSLDETVYRLSDVPTTREGVLDSALLVLYDWSCAVSLLDEEIENERGVIREEWRTGNDANERIWVKRQKLVMPGTQYAKRDVIGDTAVINNFTHEALRSYYRKWYGPDLQAIVVVGDIDVDKMERKIIDLFSPIKPREGMAPRTKYNVFDNEQPIVGVILDKEASMENFDIGFKHKSPSDAFKLSYAQYAYNLKLNIIGSCLSRRLDEYEEDPECPFEFMYDYEDEMGSAHEAYVLAAYVKDGREMEAFRIMCTELEKLRRYGLLQEEVDIARDAMKEYFTNNYNDRMNRKSGSLANACARHFLSEYGTSLMSMDLRKEYYDNYLDKVTVEELNKMIADNIPEGERNMFIVGTGKDKADANGIGCDKCKMPTAEELLATFREIRKSDIAKPVFVKEDRPLVAKEPKAGKVESRKVNEAMGTVELTLTNGVRVIIKQTDNEKDNILMKAYSKGGTSLYPKEKLLDAYCADYVVQKNGIGEFTPVQLEKLLTGKIASVYPYVSSYEEGITGSSSVKDFETMLKLNWLYFTSPRKDDKRFEAWKKDSKTEMETELSNPKNRYYDKQSRFEYGLNERFFRLDTNNIMKVDQKRALQIYRERFANPADFLFYFVGDIDADDTATIAVIEKWLGGMKTSSKRENYVDDNWRIRPGVNSCYFKEPMTTKTATNSLTITGYGIEYNMRNKIIASLIGEILSTRYLESIREKEGGSYGVYAGCSFSVIPNVALSLNVEFDTDPDKQNRLLNIVYDEIEKIIAEGPLASDLSKEKEILINKRPKQLIDNYSWLYMFLPMYYEENINFLANFDEVVNSITGEEVQEMLKKLYEQRNHSEVVMMPTR